MRFLLGEDEISACATLCHLSGLNSAFSAFLAGENMGMRVERIEIALIHPPKKAPAEKFKPLRRDQDGTLSGAFREPRGESYASPKTKYGS